MGNMKITTRIITIIMNRETKHQVKVIKSEMLKTVWKLSSGLLTLIVTR